MPKLFKNDVPLNVIWLDNISTTKEYGRNGFVINSLVVEHKLVVILFKVVFCSSSNQPEVIWAVDHQHLKECTSSHVEVAP